jgi:prolyl oligopeptidase
LPSLRSRRIRQSPSLPTRLRTRPQTNIRASTSPTNYRWLESWDDPAAQQWSAAENARTREYLDHLPARSALKLRLRQLANARSVTYSNLQFRAGMLFAQKHQPKLQQPLLVVMRSADEPDSACVIFDPNAASAKGSLAVDFFGPSLRS